MKWLEQQVKGTIGALILLIWETKKEKTINWKNRPQIIDLGKDSAEDVAQIPFFSCKIFERRKLRIA